MQRAVTEEGLNKQIALMTREMFDAVRTGNKNLFTMAVQKGADVKARNNEGLPLLHAAIKYCVNEQYNTDMMVFVLPHVDDLFVTNHKGLDIFDPKIDDMILRSRHENFANPLRQCRLLLMRAMPDIEEARQQLQNNKVATSGEARVLIAPQFAKISGRETIEKPTGGDTPPKPPTGGNPAP